MGLPKGRTNNKGGRPVGSKSKRITQWEELSKSILEEHTERFNEVLANLDDEKFASMYIKILEYFKPKHIDHTSKGNEINITVKPPTIGEH